MATTRRIFTREFKVQAVQLVTEQGDSFAEAARKLDLRESLLRRWKTQLASEGEQAFRGPGVPLVEDEWCIHAVAKAMKSLGIQAISHRKFRVSTTDSNHEFPVADNVLDRNFTATKPNQVWLADMTDIPTAEGFLYLSIVEDLFSRRVVGWSMSESMESRGVVDALHMAIELRCPEAGLIAHSDRGSPYASEHYQRQLVTHGIRCSMSRRGNCWDNAPMESFFASVKKE